MNNLFFGLTIGLVLTVAGLGCGSSEIEVPPQSEPTAMVTENLPECLSVVQNNGDQPQQTCIRATGATPDAPSEGP